MKLGVNSESKCNNKLNEPALVCGFFFRLFFNIMLYIHNKYVYLHIGLNITNISNYEKKVSVKI